MEFKNLSDVPAAIREFYTEETTREETGNFISESYIYTDEDGKEQQGERTVPEYADVTRVVQIPFGEGRGWSDVEFVIEKSKPWEVIEKFINLAVNGDKFNFHKSYIEWMNSEPVATNTKYLETDEEGVFKYSYVSDVSEWEKSEPQRKPEVTPEQYKANNYEKLRKAAYGSWEKQLEMQFDGTWQAHVEAVKAEYPKPTGD